MPTSDAQPSSDNPDELFDLVDEHDHVIGTVLRGEAHRNPALWHRSVQVLVVGSDGRLLLQRRSRSKDLFPGYYCASASGHVLAGEAYAATAAREVEEELGFTLPLEYVTTTVVRSIYETEITALYLAHSNGPFRFHPVETDGGMWLTPSQIARGRSDGSLAMTPALLAALDAIASR